MRNTMKSLGLASLIGLSAAFPIVASPDSINPADAAALRAYFSSPAMNKVDDLGVYGEDLSRFGVPRPTNDVRMQPSVAPSETPAGAQVQLSPVTLHAIFSRPEINSDDGLGVYSEDLSEFGRPSAITTAEITR